MDDMAKHRVNIKSLKLSADELEQSLCSKLRSYVPIWEVEQQRKQKFIK